MDLKPSDEQRSIAETADSFLAKRIPLSRVRELAEMGDVAIDDVSWQQCAQLGWLALSLSEESGGLGLGLPEEVMLFRELGRHITPGPFRSSVIGARVASVNDVALARSIADGQTRVGFAIGEFAIDASQGQLLLMLDQFGGELRQVEHSEPMSGVDPTTRLCRVQVGETLGRADDPGLVSRMRVLAAAELTGIIEGVRDMSAAYARTRVQFGKPIGSYQAVKHRCADMAVAAYACASQLFQAALVVEARTNDADFHAANAYVLAAEYAKRSTADNIQNHGGIGFTWEHDAHLYLKRAFLLENLLGPLATSYAAVLAPRVHAF